MCHDLYIIMILDNTFALYYMDYVDCVNMYVCILYMFGWIQSSFTNLYLLCYLQQMSHDS